jgi:hypothetical protein
MECHSAIAKSKEGFFVLQTVKEHRIKEMHKLEFYGMWQSERENSLAEELLIMNVKTLT